MSCFGGGIEKRNANIENLLIKDALEQATAQIERLTAHAQRRESELLSRIANIEAANEAFLEENNKIIHQLTLAREEESERRESLEHEKKVLITELEQRKKQIDQLARKYSKMASAMSALQHVICETTLDPQLPLDEPDATKVPRLKSRAAMRESAELCLSTFSDLSKALGQAGVDKKDLVDPSPPTALKALPQASIQRVRSRSDAKPPKPSTHDLVAAALQGHVTDSLASEANALFNRDAPAPIFKQGSAQAAVAGAICDLSIRDQ